MVTQRKILHIDMDAFYAAVEQHDQPQLKGKPIVVGGTPDSRGVVATCSYEARKYGIHSAMPSSRAKRLCPDAIFIKPRFQRYREIATHIRAIFLDITDKVEPVSLDEAYLDVSEVEQFQGSATRIAQAIKHRIKAETGLIASAGVSYNKLLAKIASDIEKPDGLFIIPPDQGASFVEKLPIGRFHGIGKVTEARMQKIGIETGADLKKLSRELLIQHFGNAGKYYYQIARGIDHRPVVTERIAKSIGKETTFAEDINQINDLQQHLYYLFEAVFTKLKQQQKVAYTLTVKIKYADFELITRSHTLNHPIENSTETHRLLDMLLSKTEVRHRAVRLVGVSVSKFEAPPLEAISKQLELFDFVD